MNIVIIGTGNAATVLGKKFKAAGHHIVQVFGRDASAASKLAYQFDTESTNYWSVIRKDADFYLVAVADDAITEVAKHVHVPGKLVAHTAASVTKDVLKSMSHHYGVFILCRVYEKKWRNYRIFLYLLMQVTTAQGKNLNNWLSPFRRKKSSWRVIKSA